MMMSFNDKVNISLNQSESEKKVKSQAIPENNKSITLKDLPIS